MTLEKHKGKNAKHPVLEKRCQHEVSQTVHCMCTEIRDKAKEDVSRESRSNSYSHGDTWMPYNKSHFSLSLQGGGQPVSLHELIDIYYITTLSYSLHCCDWS